MLNTTTVLVWSDNNNCGKWWKC